VAALAERILSGRASRGIGGIGQTLAYVAGLSVIVLILALSKKDSPDLSNSYTRCEYQGQ
jgi:hypothetical protein